MNKLEKVANAHLDKEKLEAVEFEEVFSMA
jgi:hypothetical protein